MLFVLSVEPSLTTSICSLGYVSLKEFSSFSWITCSSLCAAISKVTVGVILCFLILTGIISARIKMTPG